jgi:hypothetical protein
LIRFTCTRAFKIRVETIIAWIKIKGVRVESPPCNHFRAVESTSNKIPIFFDAAYFLREHSLVPIGSPPITIVIKPGVGSNYLWILSFRYGRKDR